MPEGAVSHQFQALIGLAWVNFSIRSESSAEDIDRELSQHLSFEIARQENMPSKTGFNLDFEIQLSEEIVSFAPFRGRRKAGYFFKRTLVGEGLVRSRPDFVRPFLCRIERPAESARVYGPGRWDFLVILLETWCGHYLESRGCVRLHAAAFRLERESAVIVLAAPGFGKSHFIGQLLAVDQSRVIADEVAYAFGDRLFPQSFSLRMKVSPAAVAEKDFLLRDSIFGQRTVYHVTKKTADSLLIESILLGRHPNRIDRSSIRTSVQTIANLVLFLISGLGLQQNPELTATVSPKSLKRYIRILWFRILFVSRMRRRLIQKPTGRLNLQDLVTSINQS